ncbi:M12 family metallo-peptidase [Alkalilimnicola ehrlichii]|uniref:M12 family metallo-peptidase n=1 Tax=Alkalilimnicola ehrlichii TaxID=351052 RepID=UPI0015F25621|nr:M12 family metallo-peptidase [Alkalilimnicola ehrlichii]
MADTTLDILVLYDDTTAQRFNNQPETLIHNWINQVNQMYSNSGVQAQLRLVHVAHHNAAGQTMTTVLQNITRDSQIRALRDQYGADFVAQLHGTGNCGVAWLTTGRNGNVSAQASEWAYSVTGPRCGAIVLAHEIGHNMGLNHSRAQGDTSGGVFHHGLGHGVRNNFATIMAYPQAYNGRHLPLFSNPDLSCQGMPCGVAIGHADAAHSVAAINDIRNQLADFRPTRVPHDDDDGDNGTAPSCPSGMATYTGTVHGNGDMRYHPDEAFRAGFRQGQELSIQSADGANIDALLLRWNGRAWSTVARTNSRTDETVNYAGFLSGHFTIAVRGNNGGGDYTLCHRLQ